MQKVQTDEFKILLFGNTYISQDVGNWLCLVKRLRWATPGPSWPACLCRLGVFLGLGEDTQCPSKGEKCATKAIFGGNFMWMLFYITLYLCDPHCTLSNNQFYRDLVSLYQIIWTFTDPEKGGFWKTYLDKEKMLVTSSFAFYHYVVYSTLTNFNFCHLKILSIWT